MRLQAVKKPAMRKSKQRRVANSWICGSSRVIPISLTFLQLSSRSGLPKTLLMDKVVVIITAQRVVVTELIGNHGYDFVIV